MMLVQVRTYDMYEHVRAYDSICLQVIAKVGKT